MAWQDGQKKRAACQRMHLPGTLPTLVLNGQGVLRLIQVGDQSVFIEYELFQEQRIRETATEPFLLIVKTCFVYLEL